MLAATVHAAVALGRAPAWTVDDAWIVVRYAENLSQHGTLAWNLGGPRVEGFTSLSEVLFAALATSLHLSPMKALVLLGELSFLGSGVIILALGRALRAPPLAAGVVAATHMTLAEHLTHATSGLETELFLALSLGLALATAHALRRTSPRRALTALAIVGFVLAQTRPEGVASAALALGAALHVRRGDRARLRSAARAIGWWFVLPMIAVLAWRFTTFGALVPNTYFAKRADWNVAHLRDLWTLTNDHFVDLFAVAAACLALTALSVRRYPPIVRREWLLAIIAVVVIAAHSLAYARSEPLMDYARRFAMHDLPWLDVLLLLALSAAFRAVRRAPRNQRGVVAVVVALAVSSVALRGVAAESAEAKRTGSYATMMQDIVAPVAEWITAHTRPDGTLAVYPDAGYVPYRTKRRTIDFGLLNDAKLARSAHAPADVVAYFFEVDPDVLVAARPKAGHLYDEGAEAIVADPRFDVRYTLAFERDGSNGSGYLVYVRRP